VAAPGSHRSPLLAMQIHDQLVELPPCSDATSSPPCWLPSPTRRSSCWSARVTDRDLAALRFLRQAVPSRFRRGLVLYAGSQVVPVDEHVTLVPISALWQGPDLGAELDMLPIRAALPRPAAMPFRPQQAVAFPRPPAILSAIQFSEGRRRPREGGEGVRVCRTSRAQGRARRASSPIQDGPEPKEISRGEVQVRC
jgi:hypothetical protein